MNGGFFVEVYFRIRFSGLTWSFESIDERKTLLLQIDTQFRKRYYSRLT